MPFVRRATLSVGSQTVRSLYGPPRSVLPKVRPRPSVRPFDGNTFRTCTAGRLRVPPLFPFDRSRTEWVYQSPSD